MKARILTANATRENENGGKTETLAEEKIIATGGSSGTADRSSVVAGVQCNHQNVHASAFRMMKEIAGGLRRIKSKG